MSNAALNSLLDTLENRYAAPRGYAPSRGEAGTGQQRNQPPAAPAPQPAAERAAPAQRGVLSRPAAPVDADLGDDDANDDNDLNLNIEDNVIRELARSLRPQRR
jgi:hypothetical protein